MKHFKNMFQGYEHSKIQKKCLYMISTVPSIII